MPWLHPFQPLKKYGLGGGNLQAEYKYGKKLRSSILLTCKHIEVTKTPSKLKEHIEYGGCTELIIVGHGGAATEQGLANKIGGTSWYSTPQYDAGKLAVDMYQHVGKEQMQKIETVWLWICHSSRNGVGVCVKNALAELCPNATIYATPHNIGGIFDLLYHEAKKTRKYDIYDDSFVAM